MSHVHDLEKNPVESGVGSIPSSGEYPYEEAAVPGESFEYGDGYYAKMQRLAGKFNIEQRGIERVPENERTETGIKALLNVMTMWLSANMVVSSFAIGILGPGLFFTGFADGILCILFFNIIGIIPVSFFSAMGPKFGLRQMVLSRFWFGWYGVKLIAIFNVIACIGWSSVNSIVGAQLLNTVNSDVPGWAGILIIAFCTFAITLFGYKIVHAYEFWSWIPTFIVFLITIGVFAKTGDFYNIPWETGKTEMGAVLSFGATIYGFATGWTSYAADYTVYQPSTQKRWKVFLFTFVGLLFPLLFTQMLGLAVMTATTINDGDNIYMAGYKKSSTGGLLGAVLIPHLGGFGKFCLVILALSIIANNCPNIYSVGLTVQVFGKWIQRLPRFILTLVATGVYIAIAIPGYSHFEAVLENFLTEILGYWLAIYTGVAFADHFVFKRSLEAYNISNYDKPQNLAIGIAAVIAFCFGVCGFVLGMSQTWFVGPIALTAGDAPYGGDVGSALGFAFGFTSYLILRPLELKFIGR
ncbi:purine-cytosine permease [Aureobasidium pullulans]|nr:purine-cytosine permease [Aureobasidium pullulans]THX92847.1 purine-cytosine permease [Aureobasidium pullulans]THZ27709.1 purine-cytosine permease [Aureobasidium pullulans]